MPKANALNIDRITASTATRPDVQMLFHSFSG